MKNLSELSLSSLYRQKRKYDLTKPLTDKEQQDVIWINVEIALRKERKDPDPSEYYADCDDLLPQI